VSDPAVLTELNDHIGKADDESDIWLPARMAGLIRQALDGYEHGRRDPVSTPSPSMASGPAVSWLRHCGRVVARSAVSVSA
jgi:hypothetical protein